MSTQVLDANGRVIATEQDEESAREWILQYIYRKNAAEARRETKGWTVVNRPD